MVVDSLTLRVIVVDDNRDAADTLGDLLQLCGAEVRVCYAAEDALQVVTSFPFDVGLLDVHMPGMDGCELARRLRSVAKPRRVLLVAVTGVSDQDSRQRTADAGFDLHLTKTVAPDVLGTVLCAFANWLKDNTDRGATRPGADARADTDKPG